MCVCTCVCVFGGGKRRNGGCERVRTRMRIRELRYYGLLRSQIVSGLITGRLER